MKTKEWLRLERRIAAIEADLDENGFSKHLYLERSELLDELNQYLGEKANRLRDEKKDERNMK